jgi:4-hydroxy-tetrahydrodipicolinate reductase
MGTTVCQAVAADPALELVAAVDPRAAAQRVAEIAGVAGVEGEVVVSESGEAVASAGGTLPDVAVDFTVAAAARANAEWCAATGVHAVIGTTGFSEADLGRLRQVFTKSNCLVAPNFAIGAVLMMRFAELAAPYFETAEIIELHHDNKADAPSGTALFTAQRMAAASDKWALDPTRDEVLSGARGGEGPTGIRIHSVRMRGMVANQEVILGTTGQTLTIRHDTTDRTSFMPGVLLAVKAIADRPGVTVGLDALLGL